MLRISQSDGIQYWCAICQTAVVDIAEAWAVHRPLTGPTDTTDVLVVHDACRESSLTHMLLPKVVKKPLAEALAQADEAVNR